MTEKSKFIGTGKRKSSVARVSLFSPGQGKIEINGMDVDSYISRESLATVIKQPLNVLGKIEMISDSDCSFSKKIGVDHYYGEVLGLRCLRFSMIVKNSLVLSMQ